MSTRRDETSLLDLVEAAGAAIDYLGDASEQAFLADQKTQAAVRHQLLVMGEAVKRLSRTFRSRNPDVPWQAIAGLRDILIHGYVSVNLRSVWRTVKYDVPDLLESLEVMRSRDEN